VPHETATITAASQGAEAQRKAQADAQAIKAAAAAHRRRQRLIWTVRVILVIAVLGLWEFSARYWVDFDGKTHWSKDLSWKKDAAQWIMDPFLYSMPSKIAEQLVAWFQTGTSTGTIWQHIGFTLYEATAGFVIGAVVGVVLGIVLGRASFPSAVLAPFIKAGNAIPRIVLATIFVLWFGSQGPNSKIATAFVLVFFPVFFNAFQGAREVERNLVDNARILGASRRQVLGTIVIPSAMSWILTSLHVAFGLGLIGAVVGEYLGGKRGLGTLIATAGSNYNTAGVFAGMIILGVLALIVESLLTVLEHRLFRWRPPSASAAENKI
jgi:NitT/TauT family transport system permease protein